MVKHVALVEHGRRRLHALHPDLVRLDYTVLHAPDALSARRYLTHDGLLLLVVASEGLPEQRCKELLSAARAECPDAAVIWIGTPIAWGGPAPDVVLPPDIDAGTVLDHAESVLCRSLYPAEVVDLVRDAGQSVLERSFETVTYPGTTSLLARRSAWAPISAILPFSGLSVNGVLVVSGGDDHLASIFRHLVPGRVESTMKEMEDLAGEMANQILGQVKRWFVARGHDFETTSPVFLRGALVDVRNRSGEPSLLVPFHNVGGTLFVQFSVDAFDTGALSRAPRSDHKPPGDGELLFL